MKKVVIIFIVFSLLLRLILAFSFFGSIDVDYAYEVTDIFKRGGNVYQESQQYHLSPFWLYLFGSLRKLADCLALPFFFLDKLPAIFADLGIGLFLLSVTNLARAALFSFNPITILVSSYHGNFDSLFLLPVLLAWYFFQKKDTFINKIFLSAIFLGIAVMIKSVPIILLPLFLINLKSWRNRFYYLILATLPFILISFPYLITSPRIFLLRNLAHKPNWAIFGPSLFLSNFLPRTSLEPLAKPLLALFLLISYLFFYFSPKRPLSLGILFVLLTFFVSSFYSALQYFLWPLPFLLLCGFSTTATVYSLLAGFFMAKFYYGWAQNPSWNGDLTTMLAAIVLYFLLLSLWIKVGLKVYQDEQ